MKLIGAITSTRVTLTLWNAIEARSSSHGILQDWKTVVYITRLPRSGLVQCPLSHIGSGGRIVPDPSRRVPNATPATVPQDKALIEKARALGVPIDGLLTADGEEIAWKADKDFNAPINGVLVEFHKGDPIRQRHLITALRNGRCPATSLESELWQRLTAAQAT